MEIRVKSLFAFLFYVILAWALVHPIWKCASHLKDIRARLEMHFGPGPGDEMINFGPGPQDE